MDKSEAIAVNSNVLATNPHGNSLTICMIKFGENSIQ